MSKRRWAGDVVRKVANAGFVGQPLIIELPRDIPNNTDYCMLSCGDDRCTEYANVYVLDDSGKRIGECYHVSECQMEDLPK